MFIHCKQRCKTLDQRPNVSTKNQKPKKFRKKRKPCNKSLFYVDIFHRSRFCEFFFPELNLGTWQIISSHKNTRPNAQHTQWPDRKAKYGIYYNEKMKTELILFTKGICSKLINYYTFNTRIVSNNQFWFVSNIHTCGKASVVDRTETETKTIRGIIMRKPWFLGNRFSFGQKNTDIETNDMVLKFLSSRTHNIFSRSVEKFCR